jgi:16S rRNA (guanine527-N7)-methyltransferase
MEAVFGAALPVVERFAALLEADAAKKGLMGPREVDRLWDRHLVNCAALAPLLPAAGLVVDVGSGAGLPGLVLAPMRPDLSFELVDSMRRRTEWIAGAVAALELENVKVTWSRAEDLEPRGAQAVVSRAVAPLDRLAAWTAHLMAPGGTFLALKGESARAELERCAPAMRRAGLVEASVVELEPAPGAAHTYAVSARRASS